MRYPLGTRMISKCCRDTVGSPRIRSHPSWDPTTIRFALEVDLLLLVGALDDLEPQATAPDRRDVLAATELLGVKAALHRGTSSVIPTK